MASSLAEASRQFQATLEADRRLRTDLEGVVSALDVLDESEAELDRSRTMLEQAWLRTLSQAYKL